ncbi:Uma2 family endonuclease [Kovacikia minuta CCNUW1]|uniref:Uma2 family endonuclease n=1 Tax=Kovacikia minuta TaxID=2931930 RepID=UPI001CCDD3A9|nr:Uma2 family endonuclease [Kovacikia minuta]UBF25452.1 Uma2 family endonuclease [Kovacikia minuta CCNUW1]
MSTSTQSSDQNIAQPPAVSTEPVWRFSVAQYHQMIRLGILTEDDPVELLEGWLVYKMPKNPPHRAATKLARTALEGVIPAGWYVDGQEPITLEDSEPEPDVVVVRGNTRNYLDRHPGCQDLALVIEISDTTLERDRTFKKRLYARAGISPYWIINLVETCVEVYSEPVNLGDEPTYQQQQTYQLEDVIEVVIEGRVVGQVAVRDLFP